ncbi:MAG: DUF4364 family protein [Lachnospiraceae bacterium]|nr:hypothetical protein C819_01049 [Lachnospiraceae bacterium 10-1]MCX4352312.1 DUF4364 family protein [Lachnospiraceae bacterium]
MHDPLTLYKLIVLYMLDRVDFPLTKSQIGDFILEKEYTNFLTLQQVIGELTDAGLITAQSIRNRTHLSITREGRETLSFFGNQINEGIKTDVNLFFKENEITLRNEVSILSDFYKSTSGEYEAHLIAKDKNINLIDITISVPTKETAGAICDNWQRKNQEIYQYLISQLFG